MRTLHIYCDFWEQSISRALNEARKYSRYSLKIEHIYSQNLLDKLKKLVSEMNENDHALIVFLHAENLLLNQAGKLLAVQSTEMRKRITVSFSKYSPEVGKWAEQCGVKSDENEYDASRHSPFSPTDAKYGTTLQERRWIQYRLMKVLITGECPIEAYQQIIKKLHNGHLTEADISRSQHYYERDEPDMAGGNFSDVRKSNPNRIDLLRERAVQVGRSGLNTLIIGETGTGKESLAWYLHDFSTHCDKPFLAVNCSMFEGERLESELFGHEIGSFTDAKRLKRGLVEEADGGTLFLDELPEMAPRVQAKLLRFLQDGSYTRLGGTKQMHSNVRVISAAQPGRMVSLRQDLYYRVADVELHTVPLREMLEKDIVNVACNLAYRLMWRPLITDTGQNILTPDVIRAIWSQLSIPHHATALSSYNWPGNMRELSTMIKRFVLLGDDIFNELQTMRAPLRSGVDLHESDDVWQRFLLPVSSIEELKERRINLKELQPAFVRHVVSSLGGRKNIKPTKLAEVLGCTYNTLMSSLVH